jgi:hypothetical protein
VAVASTVWLAPGTVAAGRVATSCSASQNSPSVCGRCGGNADVRPLLNPSADVKSPNTWRRHGVMFVSWTPVSVSRNWRTDVWSNCSLAT